MPIKIIKGIFERMMSTLDICLCSEWTINQFHFLQSYYLEYYRVYPLFYNSKMKNKKKMWML